MIAGNYLIAEPAIMLSQRSTRAVEAMRFLMMMSFCREPLMADHPGSADVMPSGTADAYSSNLAESTSPVVVRFRTNLRGCGIVSVPLQHLIGNHHAAR